MEYKPQQYPKWKYHATETARVVQDYEEDEALGDDWADHPDHVRKPSDADEQLAFTSDQSNPGDSTLDALDPPPKKPPSKRK